MRVFFEEFLNILRGCSNILVLLCILNGFRVWFSPLTFAGEYVLSFRWDCKCSPQVKTSTILLQSSFTSSSRAISLSHHHRHHQRQNRCGVPAVTSSSYKLESLKAPPGLRKKNHFINQTNYKCAERNKQKISMFLLGTVFLW